MKLKKQVISVIIASCMAVTILPADMQYKAMVAEAEETIPSWQEGEDITEPVPEDNGIEPVTKEEETSAVISNVITADTYYSLDGKFPMYVEYFVESGSITSEEREKLNLVVTKEDGTLVASVISNSDENYFTIPECNGIVNGNNYNLTFTITDTSAGGSDAIWTETREVLFKDKNVWSYNEYLPAGKMAFNLNLYNIEDITLADNINAICLIDKYGQVAAKSDVGLRYAGTGHITIIDYTYEDRYMDIFSYSLPYEDRYKVLHSSSMFYCTRKLKTGEELYVSYDINGEMKKFPDTVFTVTDQSHIVSASVALHIGNTGVYKLYPGIENADVINILAYNIDFKKLSFKLQDRQTNEIAGWSVNSIAWDEKGAYYCVQWKEGHENTEALYNVIYDYDDSGTGFINEGKTLDYSYVNQHNSTVWNKKTKYLEYYNKEIPVDSVISYELKEDYNDSSLVYASGSGIQVDSSHLVKIPLKELNNRFFHLILVIKFKDDGGNDREIIDNVHVDENKPIYNYYLSKQQYLSDTQEFEFVANLSCNDPGKLESSCTAAIYDENSGNKIGTVELTLKNDNGKLSYIGSYKNVIGVGKYYLSFVPYQDNVCNYSFFVENKDKMSICMQVNDSNSGTATMYFGSKEIAEWYCGNNNSKLQDKLQVWAFDIQNNEIGVYKYSNGDFTIKNNGHYENIRTIYFSDKIKQELDSHCCCDIYFYYGDGDESVAIAANAFNPDMDFYKDIYYDYGRYSKWVADDNSHNIWLGILYDDRPEGCYLYSSPVYENYINVQGTENAFPVVIKITDWYSLKTIKEITVNESGHIFTKSEMDGLSPDKIYNFFLQGADGSANIFQGYLDTSAAAPDNGTDDIESSKPSPSTSPEPTKAPSNWSGNGWLYVPEISTTPEPTIQPEVTATPEPTLEPVPSPAVTLEPSATPEITAAPEPTPEPVPTVQPEESLPTLDHTAPDNTETIKDNITNPTDQWELSLKKKNIKLKKGQKAKIKITSELNTKVVYKSLKPSVATVNKNGVVTAKKAGKAVITVRANGKICKVTVKVKGKVKETSKETVKVPANASVIKLGKNFKLAETKVILKKGKKLVIQKAAGIPGKVTFTSLDKKIASVSANGVIKAKKKGKTTILIKKGKKTIKLKITIKK